MAEHERSSKGSSEETTEEERNCSLPVREGMYTELEGP
jgi:hypothetical protein